jgi:hypothetical protein
LSQTNQAVPSGARAKLVTLPWTVTVLLVGVER